ncbi:hypothetical protein KCU98_g2150, partial [Aureobasidium melanogenum]
MLSSNQLLVKLADFTVETAKLPEVVELVGGEQWPPLIESKRALNDDLQGLELYLPIDSSVDPTVARQIAERQWARINNLCAMLLPRDSRGGINVPSQCSRNHCWFTIVDALESSSEALPDSDPRKQFGTIQGLRSGGMVYARWEHTLGAARLYLAI